MNDERDQSTSHGAPSPPRRRAWWIAFGVSTAVFVLGAVAGSVLTSVLLRNSAPWRFDAPQFRVERLISRLAADLELTEDQSTRIREIFRSQHEQLKAIREETAPQVRAVLDETHALVLAELTEEQQVAWEERFERMRRRMRAPGWDRSRSDHHERRSQESARLIEKYDRNADGKLDYEELAPAWERFNAERFERMDRDSDGSLDASELVSARPWGGRFEENADSETDADE